MVKICSTPFLRILYAWSIRSRFSEVRGYISMDGLVGFVGVLWL